jgi:probable rRNA maturation factor
MKKIEINIFNETDYKYLPYKKLEKAISRVLIAENIENVNVNVIIADNSFIRELNREYLKHDYETDVISFPMDEDDLLGEIYICAPQAEKQAHRYRVSKQEEIIRLGVHGALHLVGYNDFTEEQRKEMRQLENKFIKE